MPEPSAAVAAPDAGAPVTPPAAPAAAAAGASVVPPAAAVVAPVVVNSILPADPSVTPAAAAKPAAVDPNSPNAWVLAEGVLGSGERPAWFKQDKYKSVADQAEAYVSLEKRFGAFTGAPKDGKYEFKPPEGANVELVKDHPLLEKFGAWAKENQLSQEGYNYLIGQLAEYESQGVVDMGQIKAQIGENADSRINAVAQWAKANMGAEYNTLREATTGANSAAVFKVLEAVIAKTKQAVMPKPGDDVPSATAGGLKAIQDLQGKLGPDGKRLFETSPQYRVEIERKYAEYYASQATA